jgi:excisionase family DNA binding protein
MEVENYITKKEVAKRMQISERTVCTLIRDKKIPYLKINRSIRFKWSDVEGAIIALNESSSQP